MMLQFGTVFILICIAVVLASDLFDTTFKMYCCRSCGRKQGMKTNLFTQSKIPACRSCGGMLAEGQNQ